MMVEYRPELMEILDYMQGEKDRWKCLYYKVVVHPQAAAVFIRLPLYDSQWAYELFEIVGDFCRRYPYAQPFFNTGDFPDYSLDSGSIRYMGIDVSSYQYPEQYPPYQNYFARVNVPGQEHPDVPVHPE